MPASDLSTFPLSFIWIRLKWIIKPYIHVHQSPHITSTPTRRFEASVTLPASHRCESTMEKNEREGTWNYKSQRFCEGGAIFWWHAATECKRHVYSGNAQRLGADPQLAHSWPTAGPQLAGAAALSGRIRSRISLMFSLLTRLPRPASTELCRLPHHHHHHHWLLCEFILRLIITNHSIPVSRCFH